MTLRLDHFVRVDEKQTNEKIKWAFEQQPQQHRRRTTCTNKTNSEEAREYKKKRKKHTNGRGNLRSELIYGLRALRIMNTALNLARLAYRVIMK